MSRRLQAATFVLLACLALLPSRSSAQGQLARYDRNPIIISAQIRVAMELEERAFELLPSAARSSEDLRVTKHTVYEAYRMIRFALGGVRQAQRQRFPDPTLELQDQLMERARTSLRVCLAELERVGTGRVERLQDAHVVLVQSYRTLQELQVLLP